MDINADNEGIFNSEGFYQMSDVVYFETGMLYFCDRLKDLISQSWQYSPLIKQLTS